MGFQPGTNSLQSSQRHAIHPPTSSVSAHFIYTPYKKKTIRKTRLYKFIRVAYSHPLLFTPTDSIYNIDIPPRIRKLHNQILYTLSFK